MIRRKISKDGQQYQSLNEDSFTNKKGIDVTQAPPMRDFVFDAENLDVNLDGSMSLRKPINKISSHYGDTFTGYLYDDKALLTLDYNSEYDYEINLYPHNEDNYVYIAYKGVEYSDFRGIDFSKVKVINTSTSSILCNVKVDFDTFLGGAAKPTNVGIDEAYVYFRATLTEYPTYYQLRLDYIDPYVANLVRTESTSTFDPNTAGYYTYALKDTYNETVNSVQGILAYTDGVANNVAQLTETKEYNHYIIDSLTKEDLDNNVTVILKAFCNFNTNLPNSKFYCCWEYTDDGVNYYEVPEFIAQWQNSANAINALVPVLNKLEETLEGEQQDYSYVSRTLVAISQNTITSPSDSVSARPDILKFTNGITLSSYRFTIYKITDVATTISYRNYPYLSNTATGGTGGATYPSDNPRRFYKDSQSTAVLENEYFELEYTLPINVDTSLIQVKFGYKNLYDSDPTISTVPVSITSTSITSTTQTIKLTGSPTASVSSLSDKKYLYNIKQCKIFVYTSDVTLDTICYTVCDVYGRCNNFTTYAFKHAFRSSNLDKPTVEPHSGADEHTWELKWNLNLGSQNDVLLFANNTSTYTHVYYDSLFSDTPGRGTVRLIPCDKEMPSNANSVFNNVLNQYNSSGVAFKYILFTVTVSLNGSEKGRYYYYYDNKSVLETAIANMNKMNFLMAWNVYYKLLENKTPEASSPLGSNAPRDIYFLQASNGLIFYTDEVSPASSATALMNAIKDDTGVVCKSLPDTLIPVDITITSELPKADIISYFSYNQTVSSTKELLNKDFINSTIGEKLYYKYKIYSYGVEDFKNNIYISDSNSFITSLLNTIELPMGQDSVITTLVPWREYLIAANESELFLITPQGGNAYTSKLINTFIGVPWKDRKTAKAILNGIIFKSGNKIYSVQPSMYASDDSILNIVDISKPIAPYIVDTAKDNLAFTTEQYYYLCIPDAHKTTVLKYEYATRIWTKHKYPIEFKDVIVNTVDDIRIITEVGVFEFDAPLNTHYTYGDYISGTDNTPFEFYIDTGQKSYSMNLVKQFVESKLTFALTDNKDEMPLTIDVYVDQYRPVLHQDVSSSSSFWKKLDSTIALGASIPATTAVTSPDRILVNNPVMKQLFLRYSAKGYTIRHVVSGKSHSQFKFYVSYYRYKSTSNKQ